MANKDYTELEVITSLERKHDLRIVGNRIEELKPPAAKGDVGIKSRGKIDFLRRYKRYLHIYVESFKDGKFKR